MLKRKIVADSSSDILELENTLFAPAALKVITDTREFVDDSELDVDEMVSWFDTYKGKSKTSCPNTSDWLEGFGDADEVFCVTITGGLSGSYNAASAAKQMYESENPGKRVYVVDSLSAGPELRLIVGKLEEFIHADMPFDDICREIEAYKQRTGLTFMLESLKNFASNGRVSPAVAKLVGVLGIRIVGIASDQGTLEPTNKCRGEEKSLNTIVDLLQSKGLRRGKVHISHCWNEAAANKLKDKLLAALPQVEIHIHRCRGLCSYYAEKHGLLVGYEKL